MEATLEQEKRENRSFFGWIVSIFIIMVLFGLISSKNSKIEQYENLTRDLHFELYEYKINIVKENKELLTKYISTNFKELKEYRVVSLEKFKDGNKLTVIINEPIKTLENKLGYKKDNYYNVFVKIDPISFEVLEHIKFSTQKKPKEKENELVDNVYFFILKYFSKSLEPLIKFQEDLSGIFFSRERDSIENPITIWKNK